MKELIRKYIDEHVISEKYDNEKIKEDIITIVNTYTKTDKESDNSCIVMIQEENINDLDINIYFKDEDKNNLKWKLHYWGITKADVAFKEIKEKD